MINDEGPDFWDGNYLTFGWGYGIWKAYQLVVDPSCGNVWAKFRLRSLLPLFALMAVLEAVSRCHTNKFWPTKRIYNSSFIFESETAKPGTAMGVSSRRWQFKETQDPTSPNVSAVR